MIKKFIKKFLSITLVTILVAIMLVMAVTVLGIILKDEKQLSPWGTGFFVVVTGSMEPVIPVGSIIIANAVSADSIVEGDIIVFLANDGQTVITHRVVDISVEDEGYVFVTRGDGNKTNDPPINYERVIGRVFYIIHGNSRITSLFKNANNIGIVIISAGLAICFASIVGSLLKRVLVSGKNKPGANNQPDEIVQPDVDIQKERIREVSIQEECILPEGDRQPEGNKTKGDNPL